MKEKLYKNEKLMHLTYSYFRNSTIINKNFTVHRVLVVCVIGKVLCSKLSKKTLRFSFSHLTHTNTLSMRILRSFALEELRE